MGQPAFLWLSPFLTRISNRFGIDAHYFAKNTAAITAAHGIATLKGLITGYLVTRWFPVEMYGSYRFILTIIGIVSFTALPGLPSAIAKAIAQKENFPLQYIIRFYSAACLLGSILLLACIGFLPLWNKLELWPLFVMAALLFVPSNVASNIFGGIIRGKGRFDQAFIPGLISNSLITISVLIMLLVQPSPLMLLVLTTAIPSLVFLFYIRSSLKEYPSVDPSSSVPRTSFYLSLATIPVSLSWYLDGLIISALFGLNQLALFSVAMLIPEQIKLWAKELLPIVFAKQASGKDTPERRRKMHKAVLLGTVVFIVIILCYALIMPFAVPVLFPKYLASAQELTRLTIIAAITLLSAPATLYPQYLEARGMIRETQWSNWTASLVFVIALVTLIPNLGILGAVLARGFFRFTYAGVAWFFVMRAPYQYSS
jgi:O-antigen/teichoic acid export membrane protein